MTNTSEHPDVTEISDLSEGLLTPSRAAEIREHLESCEICSEVQESLEEIRSMLGTLPQPSPMPVDVAERIDAALAAEALLAATAPAGATAAIIDEGSTGESAAVETAAEAPRQTDSAEPHVSRETSTGFTADRPAGHARGTTGPGRRGKNPRGRRRTVALSAVFTVAALGVGALLLQGGTDNPSAQKPEAAAALDFSGTPMQKRVDSLLSDGKKSPGKDSALTSPSNGVKSSPNAATTNEPFRENTATVKIPECIEKGIGKAGAAPLAAEKGTFKGTAAYLVVLPHPSDRTRVSAYVVDSACVQDSPNGKGKVLTVHSFPRR